MTIDASIQHQRFLAADMLLGLSDAARHEYLHANAARVVDRPEEIRS